MSILDISEKPSSRRKAVAEGRILLSQRSLNAIKGGEVRKGDPFEVARAAGLLAIKRVPEMIPHCHTIPIAHATIEFKVRDEGVSCCCTVEATYKTGVEMEALAGAAAALLTLWDMLKYLEKDEEGQYPTMEICSLKVLRKEKQDG
ncbi:MAG: cyclic pyranopterin monophosphate synthase MoaC [Candidatus Thermoplasmatota archaeon]